MDARARMLAQFSTLSPRLQAAARFVVDHPNEVVIGSMRALAQRAGAQPATLVRLAQQLGYAGWPALKAAFAADLGLQSQGYGQRARHLTTHGRRNNLSAELFAAQHDNLAATAAACGPVLADAVRLLKKARAVHVAGFRASFSVAHALVYGYRLCRDSVHLVDAQGGTLEMQLRPIAQRDVVVVISFAPYSREALLVLDAARAAGARSVVLTDSHASPLAMAADVALLFSAVSPSFFPSVAAAVAVVEALLELLVADAGPAAVHKIEQAEHGLRRAGAYLPATGRQKPS